MIVQKIYGTMPENDIAKLISEHIHHRLKRMNIFRKPYYMLWIEDMNIEHLIPSYP